MPRSLRFLRTADDARDGGVGFGSPRFRHNQSTMKAVRPLIAIPPLRTYPKLGMQLGRRSETPSSGTAFAAGYDPSSLLRPIGWHLGSISLVSRMIELPGYHMKNCMMTCVPRWKQHRAPGVRRLFS